MVTIRKIDTLFGVCRNDTMQGFDSVAARPKDFFRRAILWIAELEEKRRSRVALSDLNDEQLADIGVTLLEARREAARPFWN